MKTPKPILWGADPGSRVGQPACACTRRILLILLFCSLGAGRTAFAQFAFSDVTAEAGIDFTHDAVEDPNYWIMGTGAAWLDFDRDGNLDLYVTQGHGANRLYRNDGAGTFTEVAEAVGADDSNHGGGGVSVADYDNDGWPDLFLANADDDVLLKNQHGMAFVDVTREVGFEPDDERGSSASWGDYDSDGFLDLYVANHMNVRGSAFSRKDRLYHNNGDGTFSEVSGRLGEENLTGFGFIGAFTDFDRDGDADIFLINDCPLYNAPLPTKVFRNEDGPDPLDWNFTEVSSDIGAGQCIHGMGIAVGDYDRDQWLDYFYTNTSRALLLHNDGGTFSDMTDKAGVGIQPKTAIIYWTWGSNFFDYDLDGWLDLFVAAGTLSEYQRPLVQPNYLFHNSGDGTFEDVSSFSGVDNDEKGRTSVVGDYDGDGDLDLFLVNGDGRAHLFRNDLDTDRHFLVIDLEGVASNRDGIGAWIEVDLPGGTTLVHEVRSGSSLGGGDDIRAHFGLGEKEKVAQIRVRWPSGFKQVVGSTEADQVLTITEDASQATGITREAPGESAVLGQPFPNPFSDITRVPVPPADGLVEVVVQDVMGRVVRRLRRTAASGAQIVWDGRNATGMKVPAGVYFLSLNSWSSMPPRPVTVVKLDG